MVSTPWRTAARRSAWIVADQGVSSLTNFAATLVIARSLDADAFGAFSVAFLVTALMITVDRAVVALPLAIRTSTRTDQRDELAAAAGAALVCGGVGGLVVLGAAAAIGGQVGGALAVVGVLAPGLALQDTWRFTFFTARRPCKALVNDLVWATAQGALFAAILLADEDSAATLTAAWAGGAVVAALAGTVQAGMLPALSRTWSYLSRHRRLGGVFALEVVISRGLYQVTVMALGVILGVGGVGAIRGSQALFGPYTVALLGLQSAGIPEGSRLLQRAPHRLDLVLKAMSATLVTVSLAWGTVLLVIPNAWGRALLGDTWSSARDVLVPTTVMTAGIGAACGAIVGLRILSAAVSSLKVRIVAGVAALATAVAGGALGGLTLGVWGLCVGSWINAAGTWWALGRVPRPQAGHVGGDAVPGVGRTVGPSGPPEPTRESPIVRAQNV
jgi:O-antigen/teichoic acid export membrane protein